MHKIPLYALIVSLSFVTVMAAHAQLFSASGLQAAPAVTVLPQPRPKHLVQVKRVPAKAKAAAQVKAAAQKPPAKTAGAKAVAVKIIWDKTSPAKTTVAQKTVVKKPAPTPVKAAAAKKPPATTPVAAVKIIWDKNPPAKPAPKKALPATTAAVKQAVAEKTAVKKGGAKTAVATPSPAKAPPAPAAASKTETAKTAGGSAKKPKTAEAAAATAAGKIANPDANPPPIVDVNETIPLPPYPPHALTSVGTLRHYTLGEQDTLLDVARYFDIGYVEMRAANPGVDPWTPVPGSQVVIPSFKLIPRTPYQSGIILNLAQMRLFYFGAPGQPPVTYPIGIGRDGLWTPTGHTTIISKKIGPYWFPTPRMREEEPFLPVAVPPGPNNPLGSRALYLGWPEYRIHGTNLPWAVGRSVSSGCMRMYSRDILHLYNIVPVGANVTVVNQPILVGWVGSKLYLEADPSKTQNVDIEITGTHKIKPLTDGLKKVIIAAAGHDSDKIDWAVAKQVVAERLGYPVMIANLKGPVVSPHKAKQTAHRDMVVPSVVARYDFNQ